jgi:hypothetical protein
MCVGGWFLSMSYGHSPVLPHFYGICSYPITLCGMITTVLGIRKWRRAGLTENVEQLRPTGRTANR